MLEETCWDVVWLPWRKEHMGWLSSNADELLKPADS